MLKARNVTINNIEEFSTICMNNNNACSIIECPSINSNNKSYTKLIPYWGICPGGTYWKKYEKKQIKFSDDIFIPGISSNFHNNETEFIKEAISMSKYIVEVKNNETIYLDNNENTFNSYYNIPNLDTKKFKDKIRTIDDHNLYLGFSNKYSISFYLKINNIDNETDKLLLEIKNKDGYFSPKITIPKGTMDIKIQIDTIDPEDNNKIHNEISTISSSFIKSNYWFPVIVKIDGANKKMEYFIDNPNSFNSDTQRFNIKSEKVLKHYPVFLDDSANIKYFSYNNDRLILANVFIYNNYITSQYMSEQIFIPQRAPPCNTTELLNNKPLIDLGTLLINNNDEISITQNPKYRNASVKTYNNIVFFSGIANNIEQLNDIPNANAINSILYFKSHSLNNNTGTKVIGSANRSNENQENKLDNIIEIRQKRIKSSLNTIVNNINLDGTFYKKINSLPKDIESNKLYEYQYLNLTVQPFSDINPNGITTDNFFLLGSMTISFWFKSNPLSNKREGIFDKTYWSEGAITAENAGSTLSYYFGDGINSSEYGWCNSGLIPKDNKWYHAVIIRDNTNKKIKWYINGINRNSNFKWPKVDNTIKQQRRENAVVGYNYTGNKFSGELNCFKVYNTALPEEYVNTLYNFGINGSINFSLGNSLTRYIKLQIPGDNKILSVAQVRAFDTNGNNVALGKPATQSSTHQSGKGVANSATDGKYSWNPNTRSGNDFSKGSVTHTKKTRNPWLEIDLQKNYIIKKIEVYNRPECCRDRIIGTRISLLNKNKIETDYKVWNKSNPMPIDNINKTLSGKTCQNWQTQSPHKHRFSFPTQITGRHGWIVDTYQVRTNIPNSTKYSDKRNIIYGHDNTSGVIQGGRAFNSLKCPNGEYIKKLYVHPNGWGGGYSDLKRIEGIQCSNGVDIRCKNIYNGKLEGCGRPNFSSVGSKIPRECKNRNDNRCQARTVGRAADKNKQSEKDQYYPKLIESGLNPRGHNFCRNPDRYPGGLWCYTNDSNTRWEYCGVDGLNVGDGTDSNHTGVGKNKLYNIPINFEPRLKSFTFDGSTGFSKMDKTYFNNDINYYFVDDIIVLNGLIKSDTNSIDADKIIGVLPYFIRPTSTKIFTVKTGANNDNNLTLKITTEGFIMSQEQAIINDSWISLNNILYSVRRNQVNLNNIYTNLVKKVVDIKIDFRSDVNLVILSGLLKYINSNSQAENNSLITIAKLPINCWPNANLYFYTNIEYIKITTTGEIQIPSNLPFNRNISLDSIVYFTNK